MDTIIVTDDPSGWDFLSALAPIVEATTYISSEHYDLNCSLRVINLCHTYVHQSIGYYVSLLAHARDQRTIPSVNSIQDVLNTSLSQLISEDIESIIQTSLHEIKASEFVFSLYFGQNMAKCHQKLAKKLHELFPLPMIRFVFEHKKNWKIKKLEGITLKDIPLHHLDFMKEAAKAYLSKKRFRQWRKKQRYHDLAILIDPSELNAPSNQKALTYFQEAGESMGLNIDFIEKCNCKTVAEYDALFIRTTTAVNHYTYRISRRAFQENLVVIDDPQSIIKCSNKVYLAELLRTHQIPTPETRFLGKYETTLPNIHFPCVLKKPDGAFSQGVVKIPDKKSLEKSLQQFFKTSDLVLIQPFIPTSFDWRIGVLDNKPIFACRYYMAEDHWQIYNWKAHGVQKEGGTETIPLSEVPNEVIKTALKSTRLIGDGLYGVDIKSYQNQYFVIEINDNPNIDVGNEDKVSGLKLYEDIMSTFLYRIRKKHGYA